MCARVRVFFLCSASLLASQANPVRELSFLKSILRPVLGVNSVGMAKMMFLPPCQNR